MANIGKKKPEPTGWPHSDCERKAERLMGQVDDVWRCPHGRIYLAISKVFSGYLRIEELKRFRHPIRYRRAVHALYDEEKQT